MIHLVAGYMLMTVLNINLIFIFIYCYKCCCRLSLFGLGICALPGTRMIFFRPNISKANMVCSYRTSQLLKWHKSLWILKKKKKCTFSKQNYMVKNAIWWKMIYGNYFDACLKFMHMAQRCITLTHWCYLRFMHETWWKKSNTVANFRTFCHIVLLFRPPLTKKEEKIVIENLETLLESLQSFAISFPAGAEK